MIAAGYKHNFETLQRAFEAGDIALLECTERATGKPAVVLVAVNREADGGAEFVPLARLFDGNPYDQLDPPQA